MPGPYITTSDLAAAVAASLQLGSAAELAPFWLERLGPANEQAYAEIVGILMARGYTQGQIDAWDLRVQYSRTLGRFFCLRDGGAQYPGLPEAVRLLDVRKDLATLAITVGGVVVTPGSVSAAAPLGVSFGTLAAYQRADGTDRFDPQADLHRGVWR